MSHDRVYGRFHEQKTEIKGIIGICNFFNTDVVSCNNKNKKDGKYQESIQSSTTPDLGYHMGKWQNTIKRHKQEARGQSFPSR